MSGSDGARPCHPQSACRRLRRSAAPTETAIRVAASSARVAEGRELLGADSIRTARLRPAREAHEWFAGIIGG